MCFRYAKPNRNHIAQPEPVATTRKQKREQKLPTLPEDGGSALVTDILNHPPTFVADYTEKSDLGEVCLEVDKDQKLRFEQYMSNTGERIACYQGRSVSITPRTQNDLSRDQRYLIHGTTLHAAKAILSEGMKHISGRAEHHFADAHYADRHSRYIMDRKNQCGSCLTRCTLPRRD